MHVLQVQSATRLSLSVSTLYDQIAAVGWNVQRCKFDKGRDAYVAKAKSPHGEEVEAFGPTERLALSHLLIRIQRKHHMRGYSKVSMWTTSFVDQLGPIAEAYAKAPLYEPKAAVAFMELGHDCERRADALRQHLQITIVNNPEPYPNSEKMFDDIRKRRKLEVSRAGIEHPIWSESQVVAYRIVHDVLGHAASGGGWDWPGENLAFAAHAAILSAEGQKALFTESIGAAAYAAFYRAYGPPKVALFPVFMDRAQSRENPHKLYPGIHPSQSYPPVSLPAMKPLVSSWGHDYGLEPRTAQEGSEGLTTEVLRQGMADRNADTLARVLAAHIELLPPTALDSLLDYRGGSRSYDEQTRHDAEGDLAFGPSLLGARPANIHRDGYEHSRSAESSNRRDGAQDYSESSNGADRIGESAFAHLAVSERYMILNSLSIDRLVSLAKLSMDVSLSDPNGGWQSGQAPQVPNGFLDYGDPLDSPTVADNAKLIDTEWAYFNQEDPGQLAQMRQAIENAFRAVLLSPRKDLRWNTIHYQDLMKVPAGTTDPSTYWNTLERARQSHNVARFGEEARFAHLPYHKLIPAVENILYQRNMAAGPQAAKAQCEQMIFQLRQQQEENIMIEDERKPIDKQMDTYQIDLAANKRMVDVLKGYIKEYQPELDHYAATPALLPDRMFETPTTEPAPRPDKYGAFMGSHLQAIAQVSQHVDDILKAALEDVHEHDGAGRHFRAAVMQMGVRGVGPKVCSFAWLLLQPMTSQLATIDMHMMRVLGHNYDKEMNNRDYFKFERELAAGRDAAGYGHMPLGQFQWAMWDNARTGPGTHSDHSGLRALDPAPHQDVEWDKKPAMNDQAVAPDWWINTQGVRDETADDWDQHVAPHFAQNQIPFQNAAYTAKVAASTRVPWYMGATGERVEGLPGQTLMSHLTGSLGLSPTEVWGQYDEPQVGKR